MCEKLFGPAGRKSRSPVPIRGASAAAKKLLLRSLRRCCCCLCRPPKTLLAAQGAGGYEHDGDLFLRGARVTIAVTEWHWCCRGARWRSTREDFPRRATWENDRRTTFCARPPPPYFRSRSPTPPTATPRITTSPRLSVSREISLEKQKILRTRIYIYIFFFVSNKKI